ncbi:spore germination protein [Ectobacillus sp. JY-23]|uniref:GerAB/ArcD/ProY family transporter n=1 Tax=Ectobacillus sp. JY-23 TaxID=2933872 RepID=UPI001FF5E3A5|nr:GerAB/ArcD/ProY family transporter [Ectobacillus sp. JY-23]UOY92866.1 spore germination protein [Ectobacillus sp. JY-23]
MEKTIPKHLMFPSGLLVIVIHTLQIGVGITGFSRLIFQYAKQDAWIAVIVAGLVAHVVVFVIVQTLKRFQGKGLFEIHVDLFGKWLGNALNFLYILYLFGYGITYIINYYAFVGEYLMQDMPIWFISVVMLILTIYTVKGGIRVVIGISLTTFLLTFWLFLVALQTLQYFDWLHFLPVFEASPNNLLQGAYEMSFSLTGFELLYFLYPYVGTKQTVHRYAQFAILFTNMVYLYTIIVTIGFYSDESLLKTIWPTLNLFKSVNFPFLEQFEVVLICMMMLVLLPNMSTLAWVVTKGLKETFRIKQTTALYTLSIIMFFITLFFKSRAQIGDYTEFFNTVTFIASFIYPVVLFIATLLIQTIRRRKAI